MAVSQQFHEHASRWRRGGLSAIMNLRDRIGYDAGGTRLEEALAWAAANAFHYVDFNADRGPNHLDSWSAERVRALRDICARHDIHLGLHTASSVNVAEFSPYVSDAVDAYLRANIDCARRLGCEWLVVHGGYHFSSDIQARKTTSLERLQRTVAYAESVGARLLLENLNFEPEAAEIHYLAHTVDECRDYFEAITSAHFGWAFTVNHANLVPEGIDGFIDAFGIRHIGEVRLADNLGDKEVHLKPGEGNIDFASLFTRLESTGYRGHYMMAFGDQADKLDARDFFTTDLSLGSGS
jgi:sugar phosphate isomerase/epimerase